MQVIKQITLLVRNHDEALHFYTDKLGFRLLEDEVMPSGKRRIVIAPDGGGCELVLAGATNPDQESRIGNQTGGRVICYLHTDDLNRDFQKLKNAGVKIVRTPTVADFGTALVFEDLYGNQWDMVQPK